MNKYFIVKDDNIYQVWEKQTNILLKEYKTHKEARNLKDHLNFGGGFDGWTPNFFSEKQLSHKYNIES